MTTYFVTRMVMLLNFIGKSKYTFDCIIISNSRAVFIYWILKADNFQNVFDGVFISPKSFDVDGYLTVENFHSHYWYQTAKEFWMKKKVLT